MSLPSRPALSAQPRRLPRFATSSPEALARLTKAIRLAALRLEKGDLKALGPSVKIVAALDLYHGLNWRLPRPIDGCDQLLVPA
ncbi:MAG: hypothetical protein JO139_02690 [Alphaproteobacteria bacterium]|nr:hypothetical protein [Alphaproteobacteria bacterium]